MLQNLDGSSSTGTSFRPYSQVSTTYNAVSFSYTALVCTLLTVHDMYRLSTLEITSDIYSSVLICFYELV